MGEGGPGGAEMSLASLSGQCRDAALVSKAAHHFGQLLLPRGAASPSLGSAKTSGSTCLPTVWSVGNFLRSRAPPQPGAPRGQGRISTTPFLAKWEESWPGLGSRADFGTTCTDMAL